jgi:plastocyanin
MLNKDYQKVRVYDIEMSGINKSEQTENLPANKDCRWQFVLAFQCMLFVWLAVLTVIKLKPTSNITYSIQNVQNIMDNINASLPYTKLSDGTTSLDIFADKIRLVNPSNHIVSMDSGVTTSLHWNQAIIKIYEGDSITWQWSTNNDIMSCDASRHIIADGTAGISVSGGAGNNSYTHTFTESGTFYFCSTQTPSLFGSVVVLSAPVIAIARSSPDGQDSTGFLSTIPAGVQVNMNASSVAVLDGCWKICYEGLFASSTFNFDSAIARSCFQGDWLFMGVSSAKDNSVFDVGAFGLKSAVFSTPTVFYEETSSATGLVKTTVNNGVRWFRIDNPHYGFHSVGFSSLTSEPRADWSHEQQVYCRQAIDCQQCLSWGTTFGSVGCSSYVQEPSFYRVLMTNTCPLIITPL